MKRQEIIVAIRRASFSMSEPREPLSEVVVLKE
jgi:hypothetical protein